MMELVKCKYCGKTLLEASGECIKICKSCKRDNHFIATSIGVIYIDVDNVNNIFRIDSSKIRKPLIPL
jgi:phage FluMu protein Com